jgi:hypothetical protein
MREAGLRDFNSRRSALEHARRVRVARALKDLAAKQERYLARWESKLASTSLAALTEMEIAKLTIDEVNTEKKKWQEYQDTFVLAGRLKHRTQSDVQC